MCENGLTAAICLANGVGRQTLRLDVLMGYL